MTWLARILALGILLGGGAAALRAQGAVTAAISGVVSDDGGRAVEAAEIVAVNRATGFRWTSFSHGDGRYTVDGLDVGGPYSVTISRIGFRPQVRGGITLTLGQTLRVDVVLQAASITVAPVTVVSEVDPTFFPSRTGVGSIVSDSSLRRLPTVNRDVYAFVQLTPQIATWYGPSPSAAGANTAFNSLLLDGANERAFLGGNASGAIWGGKPISLDAVKEYQVQLSPYDVRQGNFSGAQINAVTKSGTNDLQGTGFFYWRNEQLARNEHFLRDSPYDRAQFGFTLGGPIVHDRIHFFVAGERQTLSAPAPLASSPPDTSYVTRFVQVLTAHGLTPGSAGPISNTDPTWNAFARVDAALPRWGSRAVLELNYARADTNAFSRPEPASPNCRTITCFPLSSLGRDQRVTKFTTVLRLSTNLASGAYNEATISRTSTPLEITPNAREPLILVSVPSVTGPTRLGAGSIEFAQGNRVPQESYEVSDNLTWPIGAHHVTVGATIAAYQIEWAQVMNAYGVWQFASLDSLERGIAFDYLAIRDQGGGDVSLRGSDYGFYAGDRWQVSDRLSLTFGLRADVSILHGHPPYSATVDTAFSRRTDLVPSGQGLLSPRLGFNWRSSAARREQVRGGAGLFAGRPPMGWLVRAFQNYGEGLTSVHCVGASPPPPFPTLPDYRNPPTACATPGGITPGPVNLVDDKLKFPQVLRLSLGYDRDLAWGVVATVEGLYTKSIHDFLFVNQNLAGPLGIDRHGRVLYGKIDSLGGHPSQRDARFSQVYALENQSRNYSYNLALRLQKDFSNGVAASVAYGYSRVRDVQSHRFLAFNDDWQFGRTLSGNQMSKQLGISDFDQPHRLVIVGTYTFPWPNWRTDISLYYLGSSGVPYTYVAKGDRGFGDLNADGSNMNDPIYVPASAFDTAEIRFAVDSQRQAFEQFVSDTPCLRRQRGRILERNSCRTPWVHTLNVSVRQAIPVMRGHTLTAELEIFNLLNLLNRNWGLLRLPNKPFLPQVGLLQQIGETPGAASQAQPVFQFDAPPRYNSDFAASYYQMQLAARYSF